MSCLHLAAIKAPQFEKDFQNIIDSLVVKKVMSMLVILFFWFIRCSAISYFVSCVIAFRFLSAAVYTG